MAVKKKKTEEKNRIIKLPYKQELFCRYFIETAGNKTRSALLAFEIKDRELALDWMDKRFVEKDKIKRAEQVYYTGSAMGSEYYDKPRVKDRIDELIRTEYFTDNSVQREHTKLILQDNDLSTKKGGIEMYYKLRGKFAPEKTETVHTIDIPEYKNLSNEDLKKLEADILKQML